MLALLAFIQTPLGRLAVAIGGAALAATIAFSEGYKLRGRLDNADTARAQIAFLQRQLTARTLAAQKDEAQAKADTAALAAELEKARNAQPQITIGPCFGSDDASRVRDLWGPVPRAR